MKLRYFDAVMMIMVFTALFGPVQRIQAAERPATVDAARLKRVHDELLAKYTAARKQFSKSFVAAVPYLEVPASLEQLSADLAAKLEEAGVKSLLDDRMAGQIQPALRAEILNDYGFWLSKTSEPNKAIAILQKVVAVAPDRAIAWLNLADAVRFALGRAVTWNEKTDLAKIGLQAYSSYQALTAQHVLAAAEFKSLYADPIVKDVCSYVAAFYTRGRQAELWGYPDPVDIAGDGQLRHVYIFDQGTAHIPAIVSSTKVLSEGELLTESLDKDEVDFDRTDPPPTESGSWPELHMLPFRDGYYLVYQEDGGPVAIVKPNAGTVCRIKRSFTPVLTENRAPAICQDVVDGKLFDQVGSKPMAANDVTIDDQSGLPGAGGIPLFERYSDVRLDPNGLSGRIGYYEFNSGAGSGCNLNGIAFLAGGEPEKSPRAKALTDIQDALQDCRGSSTSLIRAHGQILIEWIGGQALQRPTPPRTLLRLADDKIEPVCRVEQRPTYSPDTTPISNFQRPRGKDPPPPPAPQSSLPWTRPNPHAFPPVKMPPAIPR